ncbi:MAG: hypothetical protein HUJ66_02085 [Oscillospiraceae bacterium]|nr:hypothetical protein [Oscillospiraceae bacterium]
MVTFRLMEKNDETVVYRYFPNGKAEHGFGLIVIDRLAGKIDVTELAPDDMLRRHTVEDQLRIREAIVNMRRTEQLPELTEEEFPIPTQDRISTVFADHAIQKIVEAYNQGQILEEGQAIWEM